MSKTLTKKEKKKRRKQAIGYMLHNPVILSKFRDIFMMYDYDVKDVRKTIKRALMKFADNAIMDPDEAELDDFVRIEKAQREKNRVEDDGFESNFRREKISFADAFK